MEEELTSIEGLIKDVDINIRLTHHLIETYSNDLEWVHDHKQSNLDQIDRLLDYRLRLMATLS
jgi:hypothetical protein